METRGKISCKRLLMIDLFIFCIATFYSNVMLNCPDRLCSISANRKIKIKKMTETLTQVAHHCPTAPIYLVGTKSDLRSGSGPVKLIPPHQGQSLAKEVSTGKTYTASSGTKFS